MQEKEKLNVPLFNALCKLFDGDVHITNTGREGELQTVREKGKLRATKSYGGEQYYVNCPVCGDTRHRLYISHWAFKDVKKGKADVYTNGLFYCQNEQCDVKDLKKQISQIIDKRDSVSVSAKSSKKKVTLDLPPNCLPVDDPHAPIAVQDYLRGRGFDLGMLANEWQVYAVEHLEAYPAHGPKIIYPVFYNGVLAFWQARLAWDPTKEQQKQGVKKYYFPPGSNKSEFLYNQDGARGKDIVVIVEGVTDAHRVGSAAVALFGKVPGPEQELKLRNAFGHSIGVLLLDSDAKKETENFVKYQSSKIFHRGFVAIELEKGDPADYSTEELWDIITEEVKEKIICKTMEFSKA